MTRTTLRALLIGCMLVIGARSAYAATPAGTAITETSSATFNDVGGTGYSATSNTVTTYVQNAPSMTVVGTQTMGNVTPTQIGDDTFTLTNTGNSSGNFQIPSDVTITGPVTLLGYKISGSGSCTSLSSPCSLAALQTALAALSPTAANGTLQVSVVYQVNTNAAPTSTLQFSLTANILYAAGTGTTQTTSSNASATTSDTVLVDARLDLQSTASTPANSGAAITWTVTANDGGQYDAQDIQSPKSLLGASAQGIAIFDRLPTFGGTILGLTATPTVTLNGAKSGAVATLYYSTATTPASSSDWSTTYNASAKWLAIYISGGSGTHELPSAPSQSSGAGNVTTAQVTLTFTTNQPSGSGAGNANSVTNMANSAIGGNIYVTGAIPVNAPGIALGTTDSSSLSLTAVESNATASSGTTPPGGASNQAGTQAYASFSLNNGPFGNPDATGWYPGATGTASADNAHDFSALSVPCTSNSSSSVNGLSCTVGTNIIIVNTVKNEGNSTDTIQLTAVAPTGWKVQLYNATGCSAFSGTGCTQGSAITSQSTDGGSVNGTVSVGSQTSLSYEAVYNATGNSTTPFAVYDTAITAAGQSGSGTGSDSNATHDDLIPGGAVKLVNAVTVTSTGCPAGESPSNAGACPGGTLSYTVQYSDVIPAAVASNLGTEPSFAYSACYSGAGSLVITDDGAANPSGAPSANNWATYTNGIAAAASDTTANTVFTYYPSASTTFSANQTKLAAQVGGASYQLAPGGSGTITFTAVAK